MEYCTLNRTCPPVEKSFGLARRLRRMTTWWVDLRSSAGPPPEFVVHERPELSAHEVEEELSILAERFLGLVRAWRAQPQVTPDASPAAAGSAPTARVSTQIGLSAQTEPVDSGLGAIDQLIRESERLIDGCEELIRPTLIARANRLMLEMRDGIHSENRVVVHVRARELTRLMARLRGEFEPDAESKGALAHVGE